MGLVRKVIVISGKVQKIGFRAEMREIANHYDVKGRVMNLQNGDVKAIFEGEEHKVEKLIKWTQKGPPGAEVKEVKVFAQPYEGEYSHFEIVVLNFKEPWRED